MILLCLQIERDIGLKWVNMLNWESDKKIPLKDKLLTVSKSNKNY